MTSDADIDDSEESFDTAILCPNDCEEELREAWPSALRYCPACGYQEPA